MPNQPEGIEENTPNTELERIKKLVIDVAAEVDTHQDGDAFIRTYSFNEVQLQVFAQTYAKQEVEKVFEEMIRFTFEECPYEGTMMRAFINSRALLAKKDSGETV